MSEKENIERRRSDLRREFRSFYDVVSAILFEADPAGINFEMNTDEYEPEVDAILPHLRTCKTVSDLQKAIHAEFVRFFDSHIAGPLERYEDVARKIWDEWERRRLS